MEKPLSSPRPEGRCNMKGICGKKNMFSPQLPCPVPQVKADNPDTSLRDKLVAVCGSDFATGSVCCTSDQVDTLASNLQQAEALISSCPACRNNFRSLFCSFTCSPNQAQFLDVSEKQPVTGSDGKPLLAVKTVEYYISESWKQAFFDSCKDVKFGASNGFAMDLIGGGAKNPDAFLKFMGDEKPLLGSPFQINFPKTGELLPNWPPRTMVDNRTVAPPSPFNRKSRHCDDPELLSRCACVDCPSTCTPLPPVENPHNPQQICQIGPLSCFSLGISLAYLFFILAFLAGYHVSHKRKRAGNLQYRRSGFSLFSNTSGYERVLLDSDEHHPDRRARPSFPRDVSSTSTVSSGLDANLIGARGLGHFGEEGSSSSSAPDTFARGIGLSFGLGSNDALSALAVPQPRKYALDRLLSRWFYHLGLFCATWPLLTFTLGLVFVGFANIGWKHFQVETDPVRLWAAPDSKAKLEKEYFDEKFEPFYRTQQVFMTDIKSFQSVHQLATTQSSAKFDVLPAALSWERLQWLNDLEAEVRSLSSNPHGYTLQDLCLAPAGRDTPCVVQSLMGYFPDDLESGAINKDNWDLELNQCASSPADCLPAFGQPLKQNVVFGGIPQIIREPVEGSANTGGQIIERPGRPSEARATVTTWILDNSLNQTQVAMAEEWEHSLQTLLLQISGVPLDYSSSNSSISVEHPLSQRRRQLGFEILFSTGISLEQEIGSSSNTDVGIVALSYLLMFLYAALTLGGRQRAAGMSETESEVNGASRFLESLRPLPARLGSWVGSLRSRQMFHSRLSAQEVFSEHQGTVSHGSWALLPLVKDFCVGSKFTLGLFGIAIVLVSVSCAVGIFSALGVKVTLIIAEVIPFMLLAVGVDNIFLLCHEMDRQNAYSQSVFDGPPTDTLPQATTSSQPNPSNRMDAETSPGAERRLETNPTSTSEYGLGVRGMYPHRISAPERAARALSRIGPSILLSASTQVVAFLLGAIVPMPAVRNFALYAAGSMLIVATLHCTVFVAAMAWDAQRTESGRIDCLPCIKLSKHHEPQQSLFDEPIAYSGSSLEPDRLSKWIKRKYAPLLLRPVVKKVIVIVFGSLTVFSAIGVRRLEMGLDQRLALPSKSYLRTYFDAVDAFLDVGPPVYFVASNIDVTQRQGQQALCGRFTTCFPLSMANTLEGERKRPQVSFIAEPASSWIDDFLQWLNPVLEGCCRVRKRDPTAFCSPNDRDSLCQPCFKGRSPPWNITMDGLPENDEFLKYARQWLKSPTNQDCPLGGQAAYSSAVRMVDDLDADRGRIEASHFRTMFKPLRSQADFIEALVQAQRIAQDISQRIKGDVFPYSLFFVFFEQYTYLRSMAAQILGSAAVTVFAITTVMLGSWRTGAVVTLCVSSAVFGVAGMMGYWGVQFNALTLVNLSVCSAISVEFCAHIARAFMRAPGSLPRSHPLSQKERNERVCSALAGVGSSVISGIFSTKLIGVGVLLFTKSDLLKLYYAKTWLCLIVLGLLHGLVLLPILLSWLGGGGWSNGEDENDVKRRLQRAGLEFRPLLGGENDGEDEDQEDE